MTDEERLAREAREQAIKEEQERRLREAQEELQKAERESGDDDEVPGGAG